MRLTALVGARFEEQQGRRVRNPRRGQGTYCKSSMRPTSGGLPRIAMMESTHQRQRDDVASIWWFDRACLRTVGIQGSVSAVTVIIVDVVGHDLTQVLLIQNNHVVQTFAADRPDQPFHNRILPRRPQRDQLLFQTQPLDLVDEVTLVRVPVERRYAPTTVRLSRISVRLFRIGCPNSSEYAVSHEDVFCVGDRDRALLCPDQAAAPFICRTA